MYNRVYNYNTMDKATDRERLPLAVKELGSCDVYPPSVNRSDDDSVLNARGESVVCLDTIGLVVSCQQQLQLYAIWSLLLYYK